MAQLAIISETGFIPHSACGCTFDGAVEWYGFAPIEKHQWSGPGKVHRDDQSSFINHMIVLTVSDQLLRSAIASVGIKYHDGSLYRVGYRDCVSYSADIARAVGLKVPPPPNMTPWGLIQFLRVNSYVQIS